MREVHIWRKAAPPTPQLHHLLPPPTLRDEAAAQKVGSEGTPGGRRAGPQREGGLLEVQDTHVQVRAELKRSREQPTAVFTLWGRAGSVQSPGDAG